MKGVLGMTLLVAIWCAIAVLWVATSAPPAMGTEDLGEPDLLRAACASIAMEAASQGVTLNHCRQTAPPDLSADGRSATVHLSVFVKEAGNRRTADVFLHKSLWHEGGFVLTN